MLKARFQDTSNGNVIDMLKDWLLTKPAQPNFARKICEKISLYAVYASLGTANHTMTPSRLTILQLRHNFLTESTNFHFTP